MTVHPLKSNYVLMVAVFLFASIVQAQNPSPKSEKGTFLDGIAVMVNPSSINLEQSALVLHSDVELLARIMVLVKSSENWRKKTISTAAKTGARRMGTLILLMARASEFLNEKRDSKVVTANIRMFEEAAGGRGELQELLTQCGATRQRLRFWVSSAYLAHQQLAMIAREVDAPTEAELKAKFFKESHRYSGASYEEAKEPFRKLVMQKLIQRQLQKWLNDTLERGRLFYAGQRNE